MEIMTDKTIKNMVDIVIKLAADFKLTFTEILAALKLDEDQFNADLLDLIKSFQRARKELKS